METKRGRPPVEDEIIRKMCLSCNSKMVIFVHQDPETGWMPELWGRRSEGTRRMCP